VKAKCGTATLILKHLDLAEGDLADARAQRLGYRLLRSPTSSQRGRAALTCRQLIGCEDATEEPFAVPVDHAGDAVDFD
jgi:hypothetical protein